MSVLIALALAACSARPWPAETVAPSQVWQSPGPRAKQWFLVKLFPGGDARLWLVSNSLGFNMQMGEYAWSSPTLTLHMTQVVGHWPATGEATYHVVSHGGQDFLLEPKAYQLYSKGTAFEELEPTGCLVPAKATAFDDAELTEMWKETQLKR